MSLRKSATKLREAIASYIGLAMVFWHLFSVEGRLIFYPVCKAEAQP
jgi:hypothetical protein